MVAPGFFAAALLSAAACAADTAAAGTWSCTNESTSGAKSAWTLEIRQQGASLNGSLKDGEVEVALSEIKADGNNLSFRFYINGKPYTFEGKARDRALDGKYAGEEASGTLRCEKAVK